MTGYGVATHEGDGISVVVEVKTVNSKGSVDLSLRVPKLLNDKEYEIKNLVSEFLDRGKVSLTIDLQTRKADKPKLTINKEIFKAYYKDLEAAAEEVGASKEDVFRAALSLPDVYTSEINKSDDDENTIALLMSIIKQALVNCNEFRAGEGAALGLKLTEYIGSIEKSLKEIEVLDPARTAKVKDKIYSKIKEVVAENVIDNNRLEQEMIYYIEKIDITEEKVRLRNHLDYFTQLMKNDATPGKKLGFVGQEIGREINTIGSKANDSVIQKLVVNMKDDLEKIKEQSLNIL